MKWRYPYPTSPGEILAEELEARGISVREFVEMSRIDGKELSRLLNGGTLDRDMAGKLEAALGIPAATWMKLQAGYERRRTKSGK